MRDSEEKEIEKRPWYAFFSQTGTEIVEISKALKRWPDKIITNRRPEHLRVINSEIPKELLIEIPNKPALEDYEHVVSEQAIITLHGWLRIIPESICNSNTIFNGHPGLITEYPHLKGKDPQIRAFKEKLPVMGCVLHRVTPGVDEGKVIAEERFSAFQITEEEMWKVTRDRSLYLWITFLRKVTGQ